MLSATRLRVAFLPLAALTVTIFGCGSGVPRTVPVEGSLHWEDGKPIAEASVRFVPAAVGGKEAVGYTNKEGGFTLTSYSQNDGAIPGEYSVVVTKAAAAPIMPAPTDDPAKAMKAFYEKQKSQGTTTITDPVPTVYSDPKTTTLKFVVESGKKADLKLTRK